MPARPVLRLAQQQPADDLLARDPFALLVGMLLDQQVPMERAFAGPRLIADRLGTATLEPAAVAAYDPQAFADLLAGPPAVHRFPAAMARRTQALADHIATRYAGRADRLWTEVADGADLLARLRALPGFGDRKARIFAALLGKQLGVRPRGWREACAPFGEPGTHLSVADVTGPESLALVRVTKRESRRESGRDGGPAAGPGPAGGARGA